MTAVVGMTQILETPQTEILQTESLSDDLLAKHSE